MKFPAINKRPRQILTVPQLNGGLNLRDSITGIADNQLIDSKNMWFKDGILKTRPALRLKIDNLISSSGIIFENLKYENAAFEKEGNTYNVFSTLSVENKRISAFYVKENGTKANLFKSVELECTIENYFIVHHNEILYCFVKYKAGQDKSYDILTYDTTKALGSGSWTPLKESDIYAPLVMINCTRDTGVLSGTMLEGYNLISRFYRMEYNFQYMDDVSRRCFFPLLLPVEKAKKNEITFEVEYINEGEIEKTTFPFVEIGSKSASKDGLDLIWKDEKELLLISHDENTAPNVVDMNYSAVIRNGKIYNHTAADSFDSTDKPIWNKQIVKVTITAPSCAKDSKETKKLFDKVFNMRKATWFGGGSMGLAGGTRLFLGNNSSEKNLVVWSALNNPLYFSENCYFYVGETDSAVTAFEKQADMLVIFKKSEIYYAKYQTNTEITAADLMNQTVIDYAANSVAFPLTLIHSSIGCDCPDTIRLCRNRLVWTTSQGRIYTLVSNNEYSERNVFEIGEMIYKKLKGKSSALKKACSAEWEGYYILLMGEEMFLLDYNSYGYQYISSYSKADDANSRIPCYYWKIKKVGTDEQQLLYGFENSLYLIEIDTEGKIWCSGFDDGYSRDYQDSYDGLDEGTNKEAIITSEFSTKMFNFGYPGYRKNVDRLIIGFGKNEGQSIKLTLQTSEGEIEEDIFLDSSDTEGYSSENVRFVKVNPALCSVERVGLTFYSEGPLVADSISLLYRILGGIK